MTTANEVKDDANYTLCLDHGFVGLVDHMGSDADIARAARLSYGKGTKSVSEDRGLIRYLMRHQHMSPIEMGEVKLHLKLPIFVMRQLVRHRTASLNEYSGRYSVMSDEFYVPELDQIKPQSTTNKQGRDGDLSEQLKDEARREIIATQKLAYQSYTDLVSSFGEPDSPTYFPGITRELARTVLPVSNYTELYWKQDLRNLLAMLKLRRDGHAQYEIRVFAEAIYDLVKPLFPMTCEAWEDYSYEVVTLSRMEVEAMHYMIGDCIDRDNQPTDDLLTKFGMGKREIAEFRTRWKV